MPRRTEAVDLPSAAIHALATNGRVNAYLVEHLSDELWACKVPGGNKTVGAIVAHIHNTRCMWIKMLGRGLGVRPPRSLDRARATRADAIAALRESDEAIARIFEAGVAAGGRVAGFPPDVMHFLGYTLAHDAHHRGQICLLARELGRPLAKDVTFGLWQWSARAKEAPRPGTPSEREAGKRPT